MATEYKLSYTGSEINQKLGKIDSLAQKSEIPTKTSELTNDSGFITEYAEIDPSVPDWAKEPNKPTYTADEVGALPNTTIIPTVPTNVSAFTNDVGYAKTSDLGNLATKDTVAKTDLASAVQTSLGKADTALQSYTETDPTVPSWAKATSKPTYTKSEVGLGNVDNVKQYSASNPPPYPVTKVNNKTGEVSLSASDVGADASGTASSTVSTHNSSVSAHADIREEIGQLSSEIADLKQNSGEADQFDDTVLVQNAYDAETAKFNVRLAGNAGTEATYNGSLALDYIKVKYDPDAYVLISGIEKLVLNWDYYFAVNYYDADKNPVGCIIMAASHFGTYDGTLPCSFPIFRPTVNSESEKVGIENTEYVRIKLGIATKATAISATDCEGLSVKIATKADISKQSSAIPSHWETTVAEKTETIKALQTNGGKNCVSFAWASDTHIPNNAAGRTDYLGKVMARMLDNCETPFAVITGDAVTRGSLPTEEEYLAEQAQVPLHLAPLWGTDRLLVALGNHDGCWGDSTGYYRHQLTPERMWQTFFRGQALDFRRVFSDDGSYFYVDNVAQKTRFIVLNSQFGGEYAEDANGHAVNNRFGTSCYGQTQLDWLADVALDMQSGYGAVIFTHVPPRAVNGATTPYTVDYAQFNGIINAYCNKTTYSGSFSGVEGWTSNNVSVDFTNAQGEIIALFAGHIHEDTIDTETLECPIITVTAGGAPSNNDEQIYNRPYGTGLETSFDVVTINRETKMIYCTRIGAGSDRSVSYEGAEIATYTVTWVVDGNTTTETYKDGDTPSFKGSTNKASDGQYIYTFTGWSPSIAPVTGNMTYTAQYSKTEIVPDVETYTITNTLTNCSNSNSATTADYGSSYSATITAQDGYALDSVNVTMGGESVSVSGGAINITAVTGDIIIIATASKTSVEVNPNNLAEPNDTNTTDWSIWCNNARMGSTGAYRSSDNSMVTNYIPVSKGETIYFAGTGMTSTGNGVSSGQFIAFFDEASSDNTAASWIGNTPAGLASAYPITFAYYDDGTISSMTFNTGETGATYYMRLCLANTIDKSGVVISKEPLDSEPEPEPETYTVTNNLTNCTNSNSATTVDEGSSYSATITATSGYTLDSVSVTMGGSAVTSTAVSNGVISISSVTGDIVITAVASATSTEPTYTNLAVPNDTNTAWSGAWVNNARMGSDAKYRSSTNSMVTNCIPINRGDTIYFANTGMTSAGNGVTSGVPIAFYDDIEATTKWIAGTPDALTTYSITFAYNDDGTLKSMAFNEGESAATYYFRLCLANTIDKYSVIITKNEPIA